MKIQRWYLLIIILFATLSTTIYLLQLTIFNDPKNTFFYMLQDFAFVPIQVLFVTFLLDRLIKKREKNVVLNKLNMVIGIFFHETGYLILNEFKKITIEPEKFSKNFIIDSNWNSKIFKNKIKTFNITTGDIELNQNSLLNIKELIISKKKILFDILNNPNLLEHDHFTDLLWAIYHLFDELFHRNSFENISETDLEHLSKDLIRAYNLLVKEWLSYMSHLQTDYPYLYSIAVRTNPFNNNAKINI